MSGGAEDVAANTVLAISLLPIIWAAEQKMWVQHLFIKQQNPASNGEEAAPAPWADTAEPGLENTSSSAALRWVMGEFSLRWWELIYWTDAEKKMLCLQTKVSIIFLKNEQATPTC